MQKTENLKTKRPQMEAPDIREHGASIEDKPQISNRRLFCQLQVFTGCQNPQALAKALKKASLESVLYGILQARTLEWVAISFSNA